jgi:hypothetical protein
LTYFPQVEDLVGIDDLGVIRDRKFDCVDRLDFIVDRLNFVVDRLDFAGDLHGVRRLRNQSRNVEVTWGHQARIKGKVIDHGVAVVEVHE